MLLQRVCVRLSLRHCQQDIRVRFAPSPTGELHLGGLRTALYNYLFARSHGGKFIVRIEDTDRARLVPGSVEKIRSILAHYGLQSGEDPWQGGPFGPYSQSERLSMYQEHCEALIESGHAYRCFCTGKRLDLLRKDAVRTGTIPMYDRRCRSVSMQEGRSRAANGEEHVIRFVLDPQNVQFEDSVFGSVSQLLDESDPVLLKSDGFPTYHLANIVDDHLMKISDVIRGMEWLSSTGKHVVLYKAFNWRPPRFVHLPLITRDGKKKLSKRDKDAFADYYDKEQGVLPSAVLNFLVRNGSGISNFDNEKLYTLDEMVRQFNVEDIGRRNLMLDAESLESYGAAAFQASKNEDLIPIIRGRLKTDYPLLEPDISDNYLQRVVEFLKAKEEKFAFLSQLTRGRYSFFFTRPRNAQALLENYPQHMALLVLEKVFERKTWDLDVLKECASQIGLKYPQLLGVLRIALIDAKSGPPIGELTEFFGEEECTQRIRAMIEFLREVKQV